MHPNFAGETKFCCMKTSIKLVSLLALFISVLFVQSCKEEEIKPAPVVTLDASEGQNTPGSTVTINATVEAQNGGQSLVVYVSGTEVESVDIAGAGTFSHAFEYTIPANAVVGSKIIIAFQVIDKKNYPSSITNFILTIGDPVLKLEGTLATQTLDATKPYLLKGQVFIPSGVTVTIPAGTVVKGDKASKAVLIVQPGGKLIANGTATNPIVFTSAQAAGERDRGDWGGIILLGNAWVNQAALPAIEGITPTQTYGNITSPTTNADHDAGSLKYVRIEYAGIELTPNNETNSLTMGGVGNTTVVDNVQVSFGGDDGFEWFGGTVNAKHLISLSTWDDDFDTDFGWGGKVQYGLVVRNPFFADQSGSNAFESDNQANANDTPGGVAGYTRGIFSNITVLGPRDINAPTARPLSANYQNGLHFRRRTSISIFNSFISGFPVGIRLDDQASLDNLNAGNAKLAYNIFASPNTTVNGTSVTANNVAFATGLSSGDVTALVAHFNTNSNTLLNPTGSEAWSSTPGTPAGSINPYANLGISADLFWGGKTSSTYPANPSFVVTSGTLATGANFTDPKFTGDTFFDKTVTYRGALGATDWTDGWADFQPLNAAH
jgi:hypothetical protein